MKTRIGHVMIGKNHTGILALDVSPIASCNVWNPYKLQESTGGIKSKKQQYRNGTLGEKVKYLTV